MALLPVNEDTRLPAFVFMFSKGAHQSPRARLAVWMMQTLSGERFSHVAIGDGQVVLDPSLEGDRFIPHETVLRVPNLMEIIEVPVIRDVDVQLAFDPSPRSPWPTTLSWLTRGLVAPWGPLNCTESAMLVLRSAGVPFKPTTRAVTPTAFRAALLENHGSRIIWRRAGT